MSSRVERSNGAQPTVLAMRRVCAALLVLATACSGGHSARHHAAVSQPALDTDIANPRITIHQAASAPITPVALPAFPNCDSLLDYLRQNAAEHVGPYGLDTPTGGPMIAVDRPMVMSMPASGQAGGPAPAPATAPAAGAGSPNYSTTNVQEAGVDEPDIVKNEGDHALILAAGALRYIDLRSGNPRQISSLSLPANYDSYQLLVAGSRAILFATDWGNPDPVVPESWRSQARTVIRVIETRDPSNMREVTTLYAQGGFNSARLIDGVVRLVVSTGEPVGVNFTFPPTDSSRSKTTAASSNQSIVDRIPLDSWLPHYVVVDHQHGTTRRQAGHLATCAAIRHPQAFSGFGMVTVMTIDPSDPTPQAGSSVVGAGDIVYSSPTHMYVATSRWPVSFGARLLRPRPIAVTTDIHEFDISNPAGTTYLGSGTVPGRVLNEWSMSERDNRLRVATTVGINPVTTSSVTVLERHGNALVPIGSVGNLGRGERIYAVRFIGSLAYVVTFRETDPLYVIDLSDPANPLERGSLEIEGYSAYLHPVGDGLLLGVGQDVPTDHSANSAQISLFDVSDPNHPRRLDVMKLAKGTVADSASHAFLYWPQKHLAVVPINDYQTQKPFAQGIHVKESSLAAVGEVQHPAGSSSVFPIERSFVSGETLYTLSESGLMGNNIDSFSVTAWLSWPK